MSHPINIRRPVPGSHDEHHHGPEKADPAAIDATGFSIPDNTSTTETMVVGGSFTSTIDYEGDRDWIAVTLQSGGTYEIDLFGSGGAALNDTYLRFYNSFGSLLDEDDDSGDGLFSALTFTATSSGTFYISAGAYNDNGTGQYTITVTQQTTGGDGIPDDTSTTATVSVGGSFSSQLDFSGDRDWIAVTLQAGKAYEINLFGSGSSSLSDPYLRVYDASGTLVDLNDDGGSGYNSALTLLAQTGGTYYISAGAYNDETTGQYTVTVEEVQPPSPLDAMEWKGAAFDNSQTIEVYFALGGSTVDDEGTSITSEGFTQTQIDAIMGIFDNVSSFADISFARTLDQSGADIQLATENLGSSLLGYMYPQGSSDTSDGLGVLTSNSTYWNTASLQEGGFMYSVIVHELGHGLGLAHPHDDGGGSEVMQGVTDDGDTGTDYGSGGLNQSIFTIMSYNDGWTDHPLDLPPDYASGYMSTFAALDIAVLQSYYGANTTANAGATVYQVGQQAYFSTLWDTGGEDTLEMTSDAGGVLDLRAATLSYELGGGGFVSYADDVRGGFTIASGVVIENATGAEGEDHITGNSFGNVLRGEGADDRLFAQSGDDMVYGGAGRDRLHGGADDDRLWGNGARDKLSGAQGDDFLRGGGGDDEIGGGSGSDILRGDGGNDLMTGGGGEDLFLYSGNGFEGSDTITDFTDGEDLLKIGGGIQFVDLTITTNGGNTVVSWASTSVLLQGFNSTFNQADVEFG